MALVAEILFVAMTLQASQSQAHFKLLSIMRQHNSVSNNVAHIQTDYTIAPIIEQIHMVMIHIIFIVDTLPCISGINQFRLYFALGRRQIEPDRHCKKCNSDYYTQNNFPSIVNFHWFSSSFNKGLSRKSTSRGFSPVIINAFPTIS
jgi:hypothetical protein